MASYEELYSMFNIKRYERLPELSEAIRLVKKESNEKERRAERLADGYSSRNKTKKTTKPASTVETSSDS